MAEIVSIGGPKLTYWQVVEPYWDDVSIYDGPEIFLRDFARVPRENGNLLATHWLCSEVHNGGFDQFFSNSTGVLAPEALEGFRTLGLDDAVLAVTRAMSVFGDPYPRDQDEREAVLDAMEVAYEKAGREMPILWDADDQIIWNMLESDRFDRVASAYTAALVKTS
jgi:hypothetical protein